MRVAEVSTPMRWLVLFALSTATMLIYVVSLRANYLYGASLGQTSEKAQLFAWANVAADIWKGFGLVAVLILWGAHKRMALVAAIAWLICVATGVNSAIGVYVHDRTTLTGAREAKHASYNDVERELVRVEARIVAIPKRRSVREVDAAITTALAKPVIVGERMRGTIGSLSTNCTRLDARTAEACVAVSALREERAAAIERAELEGEATRLRALQRDLRDQGGALAPDPVGEFWAWATRGLLSVRDVGFGFPLFFALLIEVVSAFGPAVVVAVATATSLPQHAAAGPSRPQQAAADREVGSVMHWLAERTEPTGSASPISALDLFADYASWCVDVDIRAHTRETFAANLDEVRMLPELARTIRKFGDRYYGLRLVNAPAAQRKERTSNA